jgi:CNT family concentrative nucleoside transporter
MNILFGIITLTVIIGLSYIISEDKKAIKWRTVIAGLLGQFVLIFFVIKVPIGQKILEALAIGVNNIIQMGMEGVTFVFGELTSGPMIFAISVLSLIVFTSALISVLYFLKVIPFFVKIIGTAVAKYMGTGKVETFSTVGNAFLSGTEAPLLIKPYISKLTKSELFAVMCGGFGSASGAILAGYSMMGVDMKYLLIAVFTVPFSCLMISKLFIPETEKSQVADGEIVESEHDNIFSAIGEGATVGKDLAISVGAMLIAFVGLVAVINGILSMFGTNLNELLGLILSPIGYLLHIPNHEIQAFSSLIGIKTAVNEFSAYSSMMEIANTLSPRTVVILSVILCNFANFSVIGIQIGGFSIIAPERKDEVAKMGLKALLVGLFATLTTGAIVGMFF